MTQDVENVVDHLNLFRSPEYKDMFADKRKNFEFAHPDSKVEETAEWTKSWEYRELNFKREALTVNPAKACQPLGAVFVACMARRVASLTTAATSAATSRSRVHACLLR
jgi:nitrogenase molybdenum-iron protein beta chain